jgi:endonuclease III
MAMSRISLLEFLDLLFSLPSLRPGADFFASESPSLMTLEILLNQRVGVEKASAAALSIHHHFGQPIAGLDRPLGELTLWPYQGVPLRGPGKTLHRLVEISLPLTEHPNALLVGELPSAAVGALASLERYHNRTNRAFDALRQVELDAQTIRGITPARFQQITGLHFPENNLVQQLASTATLLAMRAGPPPTRKTIKELPRVGDETADTFLVYLFQQPALIRDDYLKRILYRHYLVDSLRPSRRALETLLSPHLQTQDHAHRLHARSNEIGVLHCFAENPDCDTCPLGKWDHRV